MRACISRSSLLPRYQSLVIASTICCRLSFAPPLAKVSRNAKLNTNQRHHEKPLQCDCNVVAESYLADLAFAEVENGACAEQGIERLVGHIFDGISAEAGIFGAFAHDYIFNDHFINQPDQLGSG